MTRKHLTVEAERYCLERIAKCKDAIRRGKSVGHDDTETSAERAIVHANIDGGRHEITALLVKFCGAKEHQLRSLTLADMGETIDNYLKESRETQETVRGRAATPSVRDAKTGMEVEEVADRYENDWRVGLAVTPKMSVHPHHGHVGIIRGIRQESDSIVETVIVEIVTKSERQIIQDATSEWMTA